MRVFARKEVVDQVFDPRLEISLEDAKKINPNYQIEDIVEMEVTPKDFGRIAAQTAKQVVTQRVREAERGIIYSEFIDREEDIMTGIVQRQDSKFIYVSLGKIEAILPVMNKCQMKDISHMIVLKYLLQKLKKQQKVHKSLFHVHIQDY